MTWTRRSRWPTGCVVLTAGRISLHLPITPAGPGTGTSPDLIALRTRLLAELGVDTEGTHMRTGAFHRRGGVAVRRSDRASASAGVITVGLLACGATACSSSGSGGRPPAAARPRTSTASASTVNVSNVTLNIGDQAGSGAEALLTAAGLIGKLPFKAHWSDFTSGPPMLQAMGAGSIDIGGVGDAPPVFAAAGGSQIAVVGALHGESGRIGDPGAEELAHPFRRAAQGQEHRGRPGQLGRLPPAGHPHQGRADHEGRHAGLPAAGRRGRRRSPPVTSPPGTSGRRSSSRPRSRTTPGSWSTARAIGLTYSFVVASKAALADPAKAAAIHDYLTAS